jgi:hypothetical protein
MWAHPIKFVELVNECKTQPILTFVTNTDSFENVSLKNSWKNLTKSS